MSKIKRIFYIMQTCKLVWSGSGDCSDANVRLGLLEVNKLNSISTWVGYIPRPCYEVTLQPKRCTSNAITFDWQQHTTTKSFWLGLEYKDWATMVGNLYVDWLQLWCLIWMLWFSTATTSKQLKLFWLGLEYKDWATGLGHFYVWSIAVVSP